jgi:hypothetical protein
MGSGVSEASLKRNQNLVRLFHLERFRALLLSAPVQYRNCFASYLRDDLELKLEKLQVVVECPKNRWTKSVTAV